MIISLSLVSECSNQTIQYIHYNSLLLQKGIQVALNLSISLSRDWDAHVSQFRLAMDICSKNTQWHYIEPFRSKLLGLLYQNKYFHYVIWIFYQRHDCLQSHFKIKSCHQDPRHRPPKRPLLVNVQTISWEHCIFEDYPWWPNETCSFQVAPRYLPRKSFYKLFFGSWPMA